MKQALKKTKQDGKDPDLTLLCIRTTPISPKIPSPLELITGRKPRGNLPTRHTQSRTDDLVRDQLQNRQDIQKAHYDTKAKDLPPLTPGQRVRFQDHPSSKWKERVIRLTLTTVDPCLVFALPSAEKTKLNVTLK